MSDLAQERLEQLVVTWTDAHNKVLRDLAACARELGRYRAALEGFIDSYEAMLADDDPFSLTDAVVALRQALEPIQ